VKASFAPSIDPQSVNATSIVVVDAQTHAVISGNVVAEGNSAVVWTLPPGERLLPNKTYTVTLAAMIRGMNGAPFGRNYTFSFSTVAQLVSGDVHREKIRITIPDENGHSRVSGDAGALPAAWQAVVTRRGHDYDPRPQATAASDGSFSIDLPGRTELTDQIDLQVINSAGSIAAIFRLTPFVSSDGRSFIAPTDVDTHFTTQDGKAAVTVPAGAFDDPATITVSAVDHAAFKDVPNVDSELGLGTAVTLDFTGVAKTPLVVELAAPPDATPSTPYYLGRLGDSVLGPRIEIVDTLRLDRGVLTTATGNSSATASLASALRVRPDQTFGDPQEAKNAMIQTIRGGTYVGAKFAEDPTWLLIETPLTPGYELFSTNLKSIFLSAFSMTEKRGRTLFPVKAKQPFQLVGYDASTGLEVFRIDHQGADALNPLNAMPTAITTASDTGPFPVFATPGRLDVVTVPADSVTLRSVRDLEITSLNGQVTVTKTIAGKARFDILDISNGNSATNNTNLSVTSLSVPAVEGDRLLISMADTDVDPEQTIGLMFSNSINLAGLTDPKAIDEYLRTKRWISIYTGDAPPLTDITDMGYFSADPDARKIAVKLPLQRGKTYRVVVSGNLEGPPVTGRGALLLGQHLENGQAVPAQPGDVSISFTTRAPGGVLGEMTLPNGKGGIRDFALIGNVALIATTFGGLQAFDVSDPASLSQQQPPPAPLRTVEGPTDYWGVVADRHGRIYATGVNSTFSVVQSFRIEDFIDLPPPPVPALKPVGATNVAWRTGVNLGVPLGTDWLITDRPEAIPRKLQVLLQDAEQVVTRTQLEQSATGTIQQIGDFHRFDVVMTVPRGLSYLKQRITIENRTIGARWSVDVTRGEQGIIRAVLAREDDELSIVRNLTTYAVVSLFGYGIGVYDLNAVESNDQALETGATGYTEASELVKMTAGKDGPQTNTVYPAPVFCNPYLPPGTPCVCDPAATAPQGIACEIRDLTYSPDALIFPGRPDPRLDIYALDQRRGILDLQITPPLPNPVPPPPVNPANVALSQGLSLSDPYTGANGSGNFYHPRLRSLVNLWNLHVPGKASPRARFTSMSPYLRTDKLGDPENFALVAGNSLGLLVVKINGQPLSPQSLVDVIWIPAGALSVRVIPRSDLALVIDNAGRILLVDLREIDESKKVAAIPACTNDLCVGELFPTAKKALTSATAPLPAGADWIEVGADDPRIVWKTPPKTVSGNIAPLIDPDTGILISGDVNGDRVKAIAAIDPRIRFRIRTDDGTRYVNSIVPLGIAPRDLPKKAESSYGAFTIELTLPGSIVEALTANKKELRVAVESERIVGVPTEQTPQPLPPAHLRTMTRSGTADLRPTTVTMQRVTPYDPNDRYLKLVRYQRAFNQFVSPWIVAVADPRASEQYVWGNGVPASQGCAACQRPPSLQKKKAPEVFELFTRGRVISVRPETSLFGTSRYKYLDDANRLVARVSTVMADTVRPPEVLLAAQGPPVARGMLQETTYLHSGEVDTSAVDLDAGGRNGFGVVISRSYRSRSIGFGLFGQSWDAPMFKRLRELPNGAIEFRDGRGDLWTFPMHTATDYSAPRGMFLKLARTSNGWAMTDQRNRVSSFDPLGRLTRDADEFFNPQTGAGNAVDYLYDDTGRLTTIVDPVGRATKLEYYDSGSAEGLLRSVLDWRGRKIEYVYDSRQRLTDIHMPLVANSDNANPVTRYAYAQPSAAYNDQIELAQAMTSVTDPHEVATGGAARVSFDYDMSGPTRTRVKSQTWATGETATFEYGTGSAKVVDVLKQEREFTIGGSGADAHVVAFVEKQVPTSKTPFGQLPKSLLAGVVDVEPKDRSWSFEFHPDFDVLTKSALDGISATENTFAQAPAGAPGVVLTNTLTKDAISSSEVSRAFTYSSKGAFLESVSAGAGQTIASPEPSSVNVSMTGGSPLKASNDKIDSSTSFDPAGRVTSAATSGGTVTGGGSSASYAYKPDRSSQMFERGEVASEDSAGLTTRYDYLSADKSTIVDPRGIRTTTEYDELHRPIHVTTSGPQLDTDERFTYDASGRLVKHDEHKGADIITTKYEYDAMGRQKSVSRDHVDVGGSSTTVTTKFDYDLANRKLITTLPAGATTTRELDGLGRVMHEVTNAGGTEIEHLYAYDLAGNRVLSTDKQVVTASAFDAHGREIATINADGTRVARDFDQWGHATKVETSGALGTLTGRTQFAFDTTRMKSIETSVAGSTTRKTSIGWDGGGRTNAVETAGRAMHQTFDSSGRLMSSAVGEGSLAAVSTPFIQQTASSHIGTLAQTIDSTEKSGPAYRTARDYDTYANVVRETLGNRLEWTQKFDEMGNVVSAAQPQRKAAAFDYDSRGAVTNQTAPDGATSKYQYDSSGALSRYTDPASEHTGVDSDFLGRPLKRTYDDGTVENFTYRGDRLETYRDREGRSQVFTYNSRGQITRIERLGSPTLDELEYDEAGRLIKWTNKDSTLTWENFNLEGKPGRTTLTVFRDGSAFGARQIAGFFEQEHTWDEHGERTEWTMPRPHNFATSIPWTDRVREKRDAMGNVTTIERRQFGALTFAPLLSADYRNAARPNARSLTTLCGSTPCSPATVVRTYGYDGATGQLDELSVTSRLAIIAGTRIIGFN
ncbi:MAG TPA: Ig-like domain-containing protein, partial [Thermoanaerobaculia bacterium]